MSGLSRKELSKAEDLLQEVLTQEQEQEQVKVEQEQELAAQGQVEPVAHVSTSSSDRDPGIAFMCQP